MTLAQGRQQQPPMRPMEGISIFVGSIAGGITDAFLTQLLNVQDVAFSGLRFVDGGPISNMPPAPRRAHRVSLSEVAFTLPALVNTLSLISGFLVLLGAIRPAYMIETTPSMVDIDWGLVVRLRVHAAPHGAGRYGR